MTHVRRLFPGALALLTAACASAGGVASAPLDRGEAKYYDAPLPVVVEATQQAVRSAGLSVEKISQPDSATWMIMAKKGMSAFSYGELVRVVVQRTGEGPIAVRVFTKRRLATNLTARGDWSGRVFEQLDHILSHQ